MTAMAELVQADTGKQVDWSAAKLGDVVETMTAGVSVNADNRPVADSEVGVLRTSCVSGGQFIAREHKSVLQGEVSRVRTPVIAGSIIISRMNTPALVGANAFVDQDHPNLFLPDRLWQLRTNERADCRWLSYFMQSATFRLFIDDIATGTSGSMKNISKDRLLQLHLNLPPIDEQRRIAEVLRSVDDAIAASREALEQSRVVQSSLITDLCFGHGYPMVSLGQILDDIRYGTSAKCAAGEENGQPVLRIPNVVNGRVEADDLKYATVSDADRQRYSLHSGDIVVVRTNGNPAYIGRSALIAVDAEAYLFASYLIRMRFDGNVAWSPYVYAALNSQPVRELLLKAATTSAGNYNINTASLKRITIPLPDPKTQHQISEAVRGATDTVNAGEYEVESLRRMMAMLMSDLLSGRVRVPVESVPTPSNVPSAFKRAIFAAEIVYQLHNDNRFGSVKHEKIVHLCELHLDLHADLDRHAYKEAAGPYDPKARRSVEGIFAKQNWFKAHKPDGNRVVYAPLEKCGGHKVYFDRYFGSRQPAIQSMIDVMRPLDTERCEIVATLYAVWNDFLIDGVQPTDDKIVASVLEWHPKKANIAESRWLAALPWMREHGLIPTGKGEKTRVTAK